MRLTAKDVALLAIYTGLAWFVAWPLLAIQPSELGNLVALVWLVGLVAIGTILETYRRLQAQVLGRLDNDYRQVEALLSLQRLLEPRRPLPPLRGWAISPDVACLLVELVLDTRPRRVLELGSGSSTVILAYALEKAGGEGTLLSVEHDPDHANRTTSHLERHRLTERATVTTAPLVPCKLAGEDWPWYDLGALVNSGPFDLVLVDGPPSSTRPLARYPALPRLEGLLSPGAIVVADDGDFPETRKVVERWMREFPGWISERASCEKGAWILRRRRPAALPAESS